MERREPDVFDRPERSDVQERDRVERRAITTGETLHYEPREQRSVTRTRAEERPSFRREAKRVQGRMAMETPTTRTQKAAIGLGAASVAIGGLGLVAPAVTGNRDRIINRNPGKLLGIFAINAPHALVHLGVGAWGLVAGRSHDNARQYLRANAALFAPMTLMGMAKVRGRDGIYKMFGLAINRADNLLHAAWTGVSAFFARDDRSETVREIEPEHERERRAA